MDEVIHLTRVISTTYNNYMKKKLTLEDLAVMVQKGFEESEENRSDMETRLLAKDDELDRKIDETRAVLAKAIADLETKLSAYMSVVREDYQRIQGRVAALEEQVAELQGRRHPRAV